VIIDAHAHLGHDCVFDEDVTEEELVSFNNCCGIDCAIIQPLTPRPYIADHRAIHDEIYRLCLKYPGRFKGMVSINPHFRPEDYDGELIRCVKELGFIGVKITPIGHAAHPSSKDCLHVYEISRDLDIPVMIHTGAGAPFADPVSLLKAVRMFPNVKFILAHAGTDTMFTQALYLAEEFDHVYLEPSWLNVVSVKAAIDALGANRIMFSSDMPSNVPVELAKYRTILKDEKELEQVMYKTAREVFNLKC